MLTPKQNRLRVFNKAHFPFNKGFLPVAYMQDNGYAFLRAFEALLFSGGMAFLQRSSAEGV